MNKWTLVPGGCLCALFLGVAGEFLHLYHGPGVKPTAATFAFHAPIAVLPDHGSHTTVEFQPTIELRGTSIATSTSSGTLHQVLDANRPDSYHA